MCLEDLPLPLRPQPAEASGLPAEKGLRVPLEVVDLPQGEQHQPEHRARNPLGKLPVLELDDGSYLTESLAIIEYFEELHPIRP